MGYQLVGWVGGRGKGNMEIKEHVVLRAVKKVYYKKNLS